MTPSLCTNLAVKLHPARRILLVLSLAVVALVWVLVFLFVAPARINLITLLSVAAPLLAVLWAAVCCTFWFHPVHGSLRENSPSLRRVPDAAQAVVRWYAAIFLSFFVVAGVVAPVYFAR
jgi:hypothetical protein